MSFRSGLKVCGCVKVWAEFVERSCGEGIPDSASCDGNCAIEKGLVLELCSWETCFYSTK